MYISALILRYKHWTRFILYTHMAKNPDVQLDCFAISSVAIIEEITTAADALADITTGSMVKIVQLMYSISII